MNKVYLLHRAIRHKNMQAVFIENRWDLRALKEAVSALNGFLNALKECPLCL